MRSPIYGQHHAASGAVKQPSAYARLPYLSPYTLFLISVPVIYGLSTLSAPMFPRVTNCSWRDLDEGPYCLTCSMDGLLCDR